uniref:Uncharacterized protein n=1 Tax=Octactis speculum TaxID=3111310 RepID=A0A7S2C3Q8_9STRA|mmetsp:Transcript_31329/g.42431  ORF Transcript_31329/g.42431 Transcript_31329/m.42431 type:complete len:101 (+) Transcript_31329:523-825(+)
MNTTVQQSTAPFFPRVVAYGSSDNTRLGVSYQDDPVLLKYAAIWDESELSGGNKELSCSSSSTFFSVSAVMCPCPANVDNRPALVYTQVALKEIQKSDFH